MVLNLTPQYFAAEERYRAAQTEAEKLDALREMLSAVPKHKASEKLQAELKRKIAALRSGGGKKGPGRRGPAHHVERSGAAQIAIVGPPNSGKSRLVADLTAATPEVADYPFTTRTPTPGIALVDGIPFQLVDLPPVTGDYVEPWLLELVRNADLLLVLLDLGSDELLDHYDQVIAALDGFHVSLDPPPPPEERDPGTHHAKHVLAGNKADAPGAADRLEILRDVIGDRPFFPVSLQTRVGLDEMFREVVRVLDVIRVYTKHPGREADLAEPFVLPRGSTVEDAARAIHKELAAQMKFARGFGPRFHDGQAVGRDLVLEDGDVLEFHE